MIRWLFDSRERGFTEPGEIIENLLQSERLLLLFFLTFFPLFHQLQAFKKASEEMKQWVSNLIGRREEVHILFIASVDKNDYSDHHD